jgi:hypothetical protein
MRFLLQSNVRGNISVLTIACPKEQFYISILISLDTELTLILTVLYCSNIWLSSLRELWSQLAYEVVCSWDVDT